jgi:hypothetical protein
VSEAGKPVLLRCFGRRRQGLLFESLQYLLSTDKFLTNLNHQAVKDIEEIKESHDKILADCKEEPTRQQLLHILEENTKLVCNKKI